MNGVAQIQLGSFLLVYVLLLVVLGIMKKCRINQTKLLVLASARMTLQLIAAGYALTFLFEHPHPLLTMGYLAVLVFFTIYLVLSRNKRLNPRFRVIVSVSIASCGLGGHVHGQQVFAFGKAHTAPHNLKGGFRHCAAHQILVGFGLVVARMGKALRQLAIVGQKQHAFRKIIKPANRI